VFLVVFWINNEEEYPGVVYEFWNPVIKHPYKDSGSQEV
jgi:hypothetical protein